MLTSSDKHKPWEVNQQTHCYLDLKKNNSFQIEFFCYQTDFYLENEYTHLFLWKTLSILCVIWVCTCIHHEKTFDILHTSSILCFFGFWCKNYFIVKFIFSKDSHCSIMHFDFWVISAPPMQCTRFTFSFSVLIMFTELCTFLYPFVLDFLYCNNFAMRCFGDQVFQLSAAGNRTMVSVVIVCNTC